MKLPNGLDAALVINSSIRNYGKLACGALLDAYDMSNLDRRVRN
jgi:hypothetical protein